MSVKANADTLKSIPLFADCDAVHLQVLAFSAPRRHFAEGDAILRQGETGASHLILSGTAQLLRGGLGDEALIGLASPGAYLGEVAMIGGQPYAISAVAESGVETLQIDKALLFRVAEEYPEFGARVFRALSRRLDEALSDLGDAKLAFDRARSFSNR